MGLEFDSFRLFSTFSFFSVFYFLDPNHTFLPHEAVAVDGDGGVGC